MQGRRPRAAAYAAVLTGALLCALAAGAAPAAAAVPVDFTVTFADLRPGETRTETRSVTLDRDATLVSAAWEERTGLLAAGGLVFTVCRAATCTGSDSFAATEMSAGRVDIDVTVTVADDAPRDDTGTAVGRLIFVADGGRLAATGGSASLTIWGVGLIGLGGVCAVLTTFGRSHRRRRGGAA